MVTTAVAARLVRRRSSTLARAGSVTMRDINAMRHANYWVLVASGFVEPVLYLFSIGVGVGALVGDFTLANGRVVSYATFVAPAMIAASAMNGAIAESTFNFFGKLKWQKLYHAMVATPVRPFEVALGELAWALIRGSLYSASFLVLMVALDMTTVAWAIPALLASLLIGLAFGALGLTIATYIRTWQDFDYLQVGLFGMFMFSGTFAPTDAYPDVLRVVIGLTPLYHGVELVRGFTTGVVGVSMLGHTAYLAALAAVGLVVAGRRMRLLLCP